MVIAEKKFRRALRKVDGRSIGRAFLARLVLDQGIIPAASTDVPADFLFTIAQNLVEQTKVQYHHELERKLR